MARLAARTDQSVAGQSPEARATFDTSTDIVIDYPTQVFNPTPWVRISLMGVLTGTASFTGSGGVANASAGVRFQSGAVHIDPDDSSPAPGPSTVAYGSGADGFGGFTRVANLTGWVRSRRSFLRSGLRGCEINSTKGFWPSGMGKGRLTAGATAPRATSINPADATAGTPTIQNTQTRFLKRIWGPPSKMSAIYVPPHATVSTQSLTETAAFRTVSESDIDRASEYARRWRVNK